MNQRISNPIQIQKSHLHLPKLVWIWDVLLIGVLLIGAYFRFVGINWDQTFHLHPDERFLTMVETAISPVDNLGQYFNTDVSSLNPNNQGYSFYVYGTLPIFLVRYIGEWLGQTGYNQIHIVGRILSGVFDLGTILLIYLIAKRLYRNPRLGLIASLFYALSVLPIQLSHYFTVDTAATFFSVASVYLAVCIFTKSKLEPENVKNKSDKWYWIKNGWDSLTLYALFAIFYGMALSSKVNIAPLALLLPLAAYLHFKKLDDQEQNYSWPIILRNLILAAVLAIVTFRIFQPYAFTGPSFFNFSINPRWINGLKELAGQSSGAVDVPYALQWVRRPVTFGFTNMVKWGLGLPLGILSWAGVLWMTWRIIKRDWQKHILLWSWVVFVFVTQSLTWNSMMRYQIQIYPILAIVASWTIFKLWEDGASQVTKIKLIQFNWKRTLAIFSALLVIAGTGAWAFAFSRIYTRPITRVAASDWIYQNIPGAINLKINTANGKVNEPVSYKNGTEISNAHPYYYVFTPTSNDPLTQITFEHVLLEEPQGLMVSLIATITDAEGDQTNIVASGFVQDGFTASDDSRGKQVDIPMETRAQLEIGKKYLITFQIAEPDGIVQVLGNVNVLYEKDGQKTKQYLAPPAYALNPDANFQTTFMPVEGGILDGITLNRAVDLMQNGQKKTLIVEIVDVNDPKQILATGFLVDEFAFVSDPRGESKEIIFDQPVTLDHTHSYMLRFRVNSPADGSKTSLAFYNNVLATESSWDDAIPLSMHNYDVWGNENGLYGNNNNFEIYWDDNSAKLDRITSILHQSDTIIITSNRQWGTITRVTERYPLSTEYYRNLIGCPSGKNILWCYQNAQPGMFKEALGFKLTAVFESDPNLGNFKINDQSAEEAFTVYDHPKVLIFQKTSDYDPEKAAAILGTVDLTKVIHGTLQESDKFPGNLFLSDAALKIQQINGTWAEIFDFFSSVSQNQWVAAIAWYLLVMLLGWMVYPFVRWALKSLPDHGYPFSRLIGLLLLALFTWLASSNGAEFTRTTILVVAFVLLVGNAVLAFIQRKEHAQEIKKKKWYFLTVELIFLSFFLIDLAIRLGNPDLWHPWKGGEKPMDLSYFTAVLKSTTFPPYDPWFSGGYINYYYYGFVIVGVPVKLLGIAPAVAYNLVLPTLFGLTALGAFSVVWNILCGHSSEDSSNEKALKPRSWLGGLVAAFFVLVIGNLGTLRMIWQGVQKLAAPDGFIDDALIFQRIGWFFTGLVKFFQGTKLAYGTGDWYWIPSRAIPGDVITEFPFFTFTYADLHAHMIALPITLLAIAWILSIILGKWHWGDSKKSKVTSFLMSFTLGGIVIGALRPTNTWDLPAYLALAAVAIVYVVIRYAKIPNGFMSKSPEWLRRCIFAICAVIFLVGLLYVFYLPFSKWYGQAYGSLDKWTGDHSPLSSYLTHWGFFFFIIVSWFVWETHEWMANTPASALKGLKKYSTFLQVIAVLLGLILILLAILGVEIGWVAFPLAIWALILILRPNQTDAKRWVLFMIGTALVMTIFVELFNLHGDIGRMNTVFKFYYQAWTLLALSSAAALIWLTPAVMTDWSAKTSSIWQVAFAVLAFGVLLYPVTAVKDKVEDRMSSTAPHTLDGTEFMNSSFYGDQDTTFDLSQDYAGIKWMQENIKGSPVIVEGNTVEYRWGSRYTIYTGLPGVLGWNWHQRQQRGYLASNEIYNRLDEIPAFYTTTNLSETLEFLKTYKVSYIVVGQLERAYYPGDGLTKFETYNGKYWKEVFRLKDTVIYEVITQ